MGRVIILIILRFFLANLSYSFRIGRKAVSQYFYFRIKNLQGRGKNLRRNHYYTWGKNQMGCSFLINFGFNQSKKIGF
jgi:hypothetical protein